LIWFFDNFNKKKERKELGKVVGVCYVLERPPHMSGVCNNLQRPMASFLGVVLLASLRSPSMCGTCRHGPSSLARRTILLLFLFISFLSRRLNFHAYHSSKYQSGLHDLFLVSLFVLILLIVTFTNCLFFSISSFNLIC
jgi:hypothetical protein